MNNVKCLLSTEGGAIPQIRLIPKRWLHFSVWVVFLVCLVFFSPRRCLQSTSRHAVPIKTPRRVGAEPHFGSAFVKVSTDEVCAPPKCGMGRLRFIYFFFIRNLRGNLVLEASTGGTGARSLASLHHQSKTHQCKPELQRLQGRARRKPSNYNKFTVFL